MPVVKCPWPCMISERNGEGVEGEGDGTESHNITKSHFSRFGESSIPRTLPKCEYQNQYDRGNLYQNSQTAQYSVVTNTSKLYEIVENDITVLVIQPLEAKTVDSGQWAVDKDSGHS